MTTTWRRNVEIVLAASGLADAFALVVAKEDVSAVKPDPEAYDLAVKRLKLRPSQAVALEDSPTGLASARGGDRASWPSGIGRPRGRGCRAIATWPASQIRRRP